MKHPRADRAVALADGRRSATPTGRWQIAAGEDSSPAKVIHDLRERVKELNCLYGIAQLVERHPASLQDILAGVACALPPAWQYPEVACARIVFENRRYESQGYLQTAWRQFAPIRVSGETRGEVSVCYREERPASFEGPFLREERTLINAVAEYLGTIARRIAVEREIQEVNQTLTVEREALRETNTALRTVLAKIDEEKRELCREVHANVEKILLPILDAMSLALPDGKRGYADLLRRNLLDITEPFTRRVSTTFESLTPTELAICGMIRGGMRTKEIARLRSISPATVNRHREHIRTKLGLCNRPTNLITFLQGNSFQENKE
jgi:hypothetical protein